MNCPDYNSPIALKEFMDNNGMAMQKKFGQNFMVNPAVRTRIIDMLEAKESDSVWEIGPGLGSMTHEILKRNCNLTAFEIDKGFINLLEQFFEKEIKENKFSIVKGDVLRNWKGATEDKSVSQIKLFGNLPYNIAATFIADTIKNECIFDRCVFTVQKEVANRMGAKPNTAEYSAFSVLCQWKYDVISGMELLPGNFWPKPKVSSKVVLLKHKENPLACKNTKLFLNIVQTLFSSRRKTIANNMKKMSNAESLTQIFEKTGISPSLRAENLSLEQFIELADFYAVEQV